MATSKLKKPVVTLHERLRRFDEATARQRGRQARADQIEPASGDRGWTREELYDRGKGAAIEKSSP
jgi:hypothetical protein